MRFSVVGDGDGGDALTTAARCKARRDETRDLLKRLASWLGEDPNVANPDQILKACADLVETAIACARLPPEEEEG